MTKFTITNPHLACVGDAQVRMHTMEPPFEGKWRYLVSGEGHEGADLDHRLAPHNLRGLRPTDVPNGLSLSIYRPKSSFHLLSSFALRKLDDESQISVNVDLAFADWHLPMNLRDFADDYRALLLKVLTNAVNVTIDQDEVGYSLTCSVKVPPSNDFFAAYGSLADEVLAAYRKALAELVRPSKSTHVASPTDAHGPRWWIRYVVVPVLGSGAVAAAVTTVLAFLR
ncbi:hypothetical protein [Variovorax boronicumulans]|uniref:hypothetical protein n=1 Tax=Variovorax boronicumulans TaxID=436515 RepID=UPI00117FE2F0|nr:hypothetical protein [Variovorax boronicumulans]